MALKVISSDEKSTPLSPKTLSRVQSKAKFERYWHQPREISAKELLQEQRLIASLTPERGKIACDLGCGLGTIAKFLASKGMITDAVDVATTPLKKLQGIENLTPKEGFIPYAPLDEGHYDLVVVANLIAEIPKPLRRLAMSQIASLIKPEGVVVLSTPIDTGSENAVELFLGLVATELEIKEIIVSHFWLNEKIPFFKKSLRFQDCLEKVSEFLKPDVGISDVIVKGVLKPM